MCDHVFLHDRDNRVNTFCKDLVAFFPDEGFIIFEGYNHLRETPYPFTIELNRREPGLAFGAWYILNITGGYKKHIQPPPRKKEPTIIKETTRYDDNDDNYDDDYESNITFFPRDIIILKFTLKEVLSNAPDGYDWRYCIDNRFETSEELLEMYESLVELPVHSWDPYEENPAHADFYKEYHVLRETNVDIFRADRELQRFTCQKPLEKYKVIYKAPSEVGLKGAFTD
jgi:hypothetical protein